jgi:hypothetical protein
MCMQQNLDLIPPSFLTIIRSIRGMFHEGSYHECFFFVENSYKALFLMSRVFCRRKIFLTTLLFVQTKLNKGSN